MATSNPPPVSILYLTPCTADQLSILYMTTGILDQLSVLYAATDSTDQSRQTLAVLWSLCCCNPEQSFACLLADAYAHTETHRQTVSCNDSHDSVSNRCATCLQSGVRQPTHTCRLQSVQMITRLFCCRLCCKYAVDGLGCSSGSITEAAWLTWWLCKSPEQAAGLCHSPAPVPSHASGLRHSWDCWASAPMLACMTHVTGQ